MKDCVHVLICPVCGGSFTLSQGAINQAPTLSCPNSHSFDIAKEGYVNLLLKKMLGDTKEMLLARRNFLECGYYAPLSAAINGFVSRYLTEQANTTNNAEPLCVLDAGCGEGYYLGGLKQTLNGQLAGKRCCYLGLDIAKEAVQMAAKRYKGIEFVVANINEKLVLADNSISVLLNVFAPRNAGEFARVVVPSGLLLIVIPSPIHLQSLRSTFHLLSIEEHKEQRVIEQFTATFALIESSTLEYEVMLNKEELIQIVHMTPNHRHLSEEIRQELQHREYFQTEVGFTCLVFHKHLPLLLLA